MDEAELYEMLKSLPIWITREELLQSLEEETDNLFQLFRTHDEPKEGYRVLNPAPRIGGGWDNQRSRNRRRKLCSERSSAKFAKTF